MKFHQYDDATCPARRLPKTPKFPKLTLSLKPRLRGTPFLEQKHGRTLTAFGNDDAWNILDNVKRALTNW